MPPVRVARFAVRRRAKQPDAPSRCRCEADHRRSSSRRRPTTKTITVSVQPTDAVTWAVNMNL
jgi:hypothetical protein